MRRLKRAWCVVGLVTTFGIGATGCGEEEEPPRYVGAEETCGGLFKGPLAEKVESVTGTTVFSSTGTEALDRVAEKLKEAYKSRTPWGPGGELCALYPQKRAVRNAHSEINFYKYAPRDLEDADVPSDGRIYRMGKRSIATPTSGSLYFDCVSPRLKGSKERPLRIHGAFHHPKATAQSTPEHLAANMEIVHAASLAVAKKLQCENSGGLPEKPVLTPES